jgi:cbb3-type cytochrome oxidase maturation protein
MSVIFVALPVALLLGGSALVACILSIRNGQFDDLETPAVRILIEESPQVSASSPQKLNPANKTQTVHPKP